MKGVAMTEFLATNWLWIVFVFAMLAMHRHGGCGMHHSHHQHPKRTAAKRCCPSSTEMIEPTWKAMDTV